jgi:ABC-2 type transport system permease protein
MMETSRSIAAPLEERAVAESSRRAFLPAAMAKAWAFIVRDYQIDSSYKFNFLLKSVNSLAPLFFFYFLSKLMATDGTNGLAKYGGDYFSFVLIGLAFHRYLQLSLRWFADSVYAAQVTGCLETMLGSQTRPTSIIWLSSFYGLISTTLHLVLILVVAALAFGLDLRQADLFATLVVFLLSISTFIGFGILSAAAIILFKRGDPVTFLFSSVGVVLGGAYFPIEVMPLWLQKIAVIFPITHSLDALRLTLLEGYSLSEVAGPATILLIMGAILLPASLWAFSFAVKKGRRDGTLMQY